MSDVLGPRSAGVLLHPTSLPGPGIGGLGEGAPRFVDWLRSAGVSVWQVLPLVATDAGGSPYSGLSAFAGNTFLLSPGRLVEDGLLTAEEARLPDLPADRVDFPAVALWMEGLLQRAHAAFAAGRGAVSREELAAYREAQAFWLEDWALFRVLREVHGGRPWTEWDAEVRRRDPGALRRARSAFAAEVERRELEQLLFDRQWGSIRRYANGAGIRILGDVPIFVAHDSADVWAHPEWFHLDAEGCQTVVAGVPPDYFSETGQRWGNPLYRWDVMEADGYRWWTERFRRTLQWVDLARIDHFRGFESYWEVPASEPTAIRGEWVPGPGAKLFRAVESELGSLPLVAEDLGIITPEVEALRDELGMPGMRVLQFAFGEDDPENPHLPANYAPLSVAYTGTHDNDTAVGWYRAGTSEEVRALLAKVADTSDGDGVHWGMIEAVMASPALLAVVPLQDVLGLGSEARMNTPGTCEGNWGWRLRQGEPAAALAARLRTITDRTGRS